MFWYISLLTLSLSTNRGSYHLQQNKCYPERFRLSDKVQLTAALCNEI